MAEADVGPGLPDSPLGRALQRVLSGGSNSESITDPMVGEVILARDPLDPRVVHLDDGEIQVVLFRPSGTRPPAYPGYVPFVPNTASFIMEAAGDDDDVDGYTATWINPADAAELSSTFERLCTDNGWLSTEVPEQLRERFVTPGAHQTFFVRQDALRIVSVASAADGRSGVILSELRLRH